MNAQKSQIIIYVMTIIIVILGTILGTTILIKKDIADKPEIVKKSDTETVNTVKPIQNTSPIKLSQPKPTTQTNTITTDSTRPFHKNIMTSLFWVGELSNESNGNIPNHESFWDTYWLKSFGGIDDPEKRCGYLPCAFTPKENPFYFALPYGELDNSGYQVASAKNIPWYVKTAKNTSFLKNTWIEITYGKKTCYAQWEDVGPFEINDFDYVFGTAKPKNTEGVSAGLDISPATWDCLGMPDNDRTTWRFVTEKDVPAGPWKEIVTTSGVSF